jgi:hypothetical protein
MLTKSRYSNFLSNNQETKFNARPISDNKNGMQLERIQTNDEIEQTDNKSLELTNYQ